MNDTTRPRPRTRVNGRARWPELGGIALAALMFGACTFQPGTERAAAPARPELRAGIAPDYPPLAFKQDGVLTGVEPQFAQMLGPALGTQISMVETAWEDLIPALREHRIDIIMSGMSITKERQHLVSFVHPYLRVGQMMVLRRAAAPQLRGAAVDRPTTRVGYITGTTSEAYVRKHLMHTQPTGFDSVDAAVAALRVGQIDIFVGDSPAIWRITAPQNDPDHRLVGRFEPLTTEYLAWAVRQDDSALRDELNAVLGKWNTNGELDAVLGRWIKVRRNQPDAARPS